MATGCECTCANILGNQWINERFDADTHMCACVYPSAYKLERDRNDNGTHMMTQWWKKMGKKKK